MKKNFTLILVLTITMFQLANAGSIKNKQTPRPVNKKVIHSAKKLMSGDPYNDNPLFFVLLSKSTTDTAYAYNGIYCHAVFDSSFLSTLDNGGNTQDLNSGGFMGEDISILVNGISWWTRCWNLPTPKDTINLRFAGLNPSTDYQLLIDATTYHASGVVAYIYDKYLNTKTLMDSTITKFNFTPNLDSVATYKNRFSIVFESTTLPIKNITLNTMLKNGTVNLNWRTTGESNLSSFSVERSTDKIHFTALTTIAAKNSPAAAYAYTDNSSAAGISYYRIKATSNTNAVTYSAISVINKNISATVYGVYPNPVKSNTFNLKLANVDAGTYTVTICNLLGQRISTQQIQHNGGAATYGLNVSKGISNGLYSLSIVSTADKKTVYETSLLIKK